jgi:hypothetical protein
MQTTFHCPPPPQVEKGGHTMIQSSATLQLFGTSEICISKGTLEQKRNQTGPESVPFLVEYTLLSKLVLGKVADA